MFMGRHCFLLFLGLMPTAAHATASIGRARGCAASSIERGKGALGLGNAVMGGHAAAIAMQRGEMMATVLGAHLEDG
jgi:hypothetical protein